MAKRTKEEIKEYYKGVREMWKKAKELAETDKYRGIIKECREQGIEFSAYGITFIAQQMEEQGLEGLPHIDTKTFNLWKKNGFRIKKGEKSTLTGIVWKEFKNKNDDDDDDGYVYPKIYNLFHSSQVEIYIPEINNQGMKYIN